MARQHPATLGKFRVACLCRNSFAVTLLAAVCVVYVCSGVGAGMDEAGPQTDHAAESRVRYKNSASFQVKYENLASLR